MCVMLSILNTWCVSGNNRARESFPIFSQPPHKMQNNPTELRVQGSVFFAALLLPWIRQMSAPKIQRVSVYRFALWI